MTRRRLPAGIVEQETAHGITRYTLTNNGLTVLLKPTESAVKVATLMIVYGVGSRNEAVGFTGATHVLEHMMFKGTERFDLRRNNGIAQVLARIGGVFNATTWNDRTNYFVCAQSDHLELAIELEADRMRNLRLDADDLAREMTVVRNELTRGQNDPAGVLQEMLWSYAFREHPYHHPTIGWASDVEGVSLERLRQFYDCYYHPNNATVCVVGAFDTVETLQWIMRHFGSIPSSQNPIPQMCTIEPAQQGEVRFQLRRAGDKRRIIIGYHTPASTEKTDLPALYVLAMLLGGSAEKSSRLYRALVEARLATAASADLYLFKDPGLLEIHADLHDRATFEKLERAIYGELRKLAEEDVDAIELERAILANRKGTILSAADPLNYCSHLGEAVACGDWKVLLALDYLIDQVTAQDIRRVASTYFAACNRTVGHFIPASAGNAESPVELATITPRPGPARQPETLPPVRTAVKPSDPKAVQLASLVTPLKLPNGATVLLCPLKGAATVAIRGAFGTGTSIPDVKERSLPGMIAGMLTAGSKNFSKRTLAEKTRAMSASLRFMARDFRTTFGSHVVSADLEAILEILADAITTPRFLQREVALLSDQALAGLLQSKDSTAVQAVTAFERLIYPERHTYRPRHFDERERALRAMRHSDLRPFFKKHYGLGTLTLVIAGDFDEKAVTGQVTRLFGGGKESPAVENVITPVSLIAPTVERVRLEDKPNADAVLGHVTNIMHGSPDYYAARIAVAALGEDTLTSRLGTEIRGRNGLTYGVYATLGNTRYGAAPFTISLSADAPQLDSAVELSRLVVEQWYERGITQEELEDEVGRVVGSFCVELRSPAGIAANLLRFQGGQGGYAACDRYTANFCEVTRAQVNDAIRRLFHPESLVVALAGTVD